MKATRNGSAVRAVTRRDFTKPVRVAASAKPRAKSEVFGTIAQQVQRARELCYQASVLHDLVGELRATTETACQQAHVARHEARERRQVVPSLPPPLD